VIGKVAEPLPQCKYPQALALARPVPQRVELCGKSRVERLSTDEAQLSTTKSGGICAVKRRAMELMEITEAGNALKLTPWVAARVPVGADVGSDIHVMLALCCSSRQVVVADEQLDGTDMIGEFLGKRQRLTCQA
jgi:hypothetical protein